MACCMAEFLLVYVCCGLTACCVGLNLPFSMNKLICCRPRACCMARFVCVVGLLSGTYWFVPTIFNK